MDNEFETLKAEFRKVIEKCIEMKWITVSEFISIDGIASQFANKMSEVNRDQEVREIIGKLLWLKDYHNDVFKNVAKIFKDVS